MISLTLKSAKQPNFEMAHESMVSEPKSLHKLLADQSKEEGVSMNQYCVYLLSLNNASNLYKHRTIR